MRINQLRRHWPFGLLLLLTVPVLFIRLAEVPYTWYDEGLNLATVRTLAETGLYALPSADGLRIADPAIQTGPPILVPLSWFYTLYGPNLGLARLTIAITAVLALIALYALTCRLYGALPAYLAALFILVLPGDSTANYIMMSRQVLGEIPALLCIALGLHLLLNDRARSRSYLAVGLLFGLAITIKSQVLLILVATLGLWTVYSLLRCPQEGRRWLLVAGAMGAFYGLDLMWRSQMAGPQWAEHVETLRQGTLIHLIPFRALRNLGEFNALWRLGLTGLAVGGALWVQRRAPASAPTGDGARRVQGFLLLFAVLWVGWYAFVSIGWQRYSFVGMVFVMVFLAFLAARWPGRRLDTRRGYAVLTGLFVLVAGAQHIPELLNDRRGADFFAMVSYVEQNVAQDAVVITWEWPVRYLTAGRFVYPTTTVANAITAATFFDWPYSKKTFDSLAACPDYVLLGSFEVDRTVLAGAITAADPNPLFRQGSYELYRIPDDNLRRLADGSCAPNPVSLRSK
ncbi:MAG: glycosyltransferase family 39 protein [Chloroflexi bacterium]|nr:glycosyltransferase family 39 protein [Chloroflexota bacterium]